jgi:hypothetical protein
MASNTWPRKARILLRASYMSREPEFRHQPGRFQGQGRAVYGDQKHFYDRATQADRLGKASHSALGWQENPTAGTRV